MNIKQTETFVKWHTTLKDRIAAARIAARLDKLHFGHFGDVKPLDGGVWEMRIDVGAGYRAYYTLRNGQVILLMCGGNKRTQNADIKKAIAMNKTITDKEIEELP